MHSKLNFICILLSVFLIACSLMPNDMKTAEKIMDSNPDSALHILEHMHPNQAFMDADRALYGILLFQALDRNNKALQPDSVLNYSINYYSNSSNKVYLATAYYYKARLYKRAQQFDQATLFYLKALDLIRNEKKYSLLGKIYSDMGDICSIQKDYTKSMKKYEESIYFFKLAGDTLEASYKVIDIARMYRFMKDYQKARQFYTKSLLQSPDSFLHGIVYQEIGINYFFAKQYDSAKYFLNKSLLYPYKGTNYAIRCYNLADLYFELNQFDSAFLYANKAMKYPATFFIQRECYRILTNTEYSKGDFKQMATYMSKYQDCTDSVRKIETQTKTTILEDLHQTSSAASKSNQFLIISVFIILIILALSLFIVLTLRIKSNRKQQELKTTEKKLVEKQLVLKHNLIQKLQETRDLHSSVFKKANGTERELIIKEIYNNTLHIDDWEAFKTLMNKTFNDIVGNLESRYSEINKKEILWCCLFLLDIPNNEMLNLLDCKQSSLYKLKYRITIKLQLTTAAELEHLLLELAGEK